MKRIVLFALLAGASPARAATADCSGAADGTPCVGPCIDYGRCQGGACLVADEPGTEIPGWAADGTACATGNACTTGDHCSAGACVPGPAVTCAQPANACLAASCDPAVGCVVRIVCVAPVDTVDGGGGSPVPPASPIVTADPDVGPPHVRGDAVTSGCNLMPGARGLDAAWLALLLFVLLRRRAV